jgi:hypothetical protein
MRSEFAISLSCSATLDRDPSMPYKDHKSHVLWCRRQRAKLITALGSRCECCGEDNPAKLELAHEPGTRDWCTRKHGLKGSILRYKKDFKAGVLKLLCGHCNKLEFWKPSEFASISRMFREHNEPF